MAELSQYAEFTKLLDADGPIALIIKQDLAPDDEEERIIFPPTYPLTTFKNRIQRFEHGEYRVSIELPPDSKRDKNEKKDNQRPGYQIDHFPDGTNICEIDSIQSQSNRIEPKFKTTKDGSLVPQVIIKVGSQTVNLLDAGHRAADAVVRMSSLAAEFHNAWTAAKAGDLFGLARLAPTTIVFGGWDSRSSQAKLQRLIKAHIRATNVQERTRSAQYTPAADYVGAGALDESVNAGEDDKNNLSQEGMKHALSTQTVGGVVLTKTSRLVRTVNVNLAAIRQLRALGERPTPGGSATDEEKTKAFEESTRIRTRLLREYILALTLLAAFSPPDLNLREGCNLQTKGDAKTTLVQNRRKDAGIISASNIECFAEYAAKQFFTATETDFHKKDLTGIFESNVAERFLSMPTAERDKVRALGPITDETLRWYADQQKDPFKLVVNEIKAVKKSIGKRPGRKQPPVKNVDALKKIADALKALSEDTNADDDARELAKTLEMQARDHEDSHTALDDINSKIKEFKKPKKANGSAAGSPSENGIQS